MQLLFSVSSRPGKAIKNINFVPSPLGPSGLFIIPVTVLIPADTLPDEVEVISRDVN